MPPSGRDVSSRAAGGRAAWLVGGRWRVALHTNCDRAVEVLKEEASRLLGHSPQAGDN